MGGCGRQTPPPLSVSSPAPVRNVVLLLQCSRRRNLGVADATAPDYTI
jgi:hypothetical protein